MMTANVSTLDIAIVAGYALLMVAIGAYAARKSRGADDYFLAGRSMTWALVGFSLFASNISSTTLLGLSGSAYSTGIAVFNYEWMAGVILVFYAIFVLPQVLRAQVFTMPEYLERRYDRRARTLFAGLTLFLNIVIDTAGSLYAGAVMLQMVLPTWSIWEIVTVLALVAGGYTVLGGLSAVMITDTIQAVLLLAGSVLISYFAFQKVGGDWAAITASVPPEMLSLVRPLDDPGVPWLGLLTGVPLLGFYFWGTNQFMAQRLLSAKNADHARWGTVLAGFLKLPVLFIMVLPGTIAIILYPGIDEPNTVFPTLMFDLLPTGVLGLVIAGFMAALMSQIDSTLNSASTLVTMDFIRPRRPELSSAQLMKIGRIVTFLFMLAAVLWAPQIGELNDSIFQYLQAMLSYTVGPVVALFLFGTFWRRANASGAYWALITGFVLGMVFFALNAVLGVTDIHFLYVAPLLFAFASAVLIIVSLATQAPDPAQVEATLWTPARYREDVAHMAGQPWYQDYRVLAAALLAACAAIVIAFW
ncbi:MAG: sodium:solute symporter [Pseudomonadota bacterium]